ncbi:STY4851/ECs_5259 family protein [Roseovarius mucosus]|uniref:STY4851/ECs_5259 family protein n=1 Tax=Roseovarius mucosus TaxID=215743 RepID=UPI003BAD7655
MSIFEDLISDAGFSIDGRPLHTFRLSEGQHSALEVETRKMLATRQYQSASAPFVLWASERYRRDYDGGFLSWDFLTEPLSISLPQDVLRDMTRAGLKRLERPIRRVEGGTQYLRTIAAEGGIPVKLLSGQGGYRAALVGLVADIARLGLGCPREVALGFSARRTLRLPIGYRTEEFRNLFVDFAMDMLELRALAPDSLSAYEVEPWLDKVKPDWRNALSLRLDGDAARSLLSEAVSVTRRSGLVTDPFCRVLYCGPDGVWTPWVEVEDTAEIAAELVAGVDRTRRRLRLAPVGQLASTVPDLLLALDRDADSDPWECRRISARRTARFSYPLDRSADLVAMADGQFLTRIRLAGGEAVEIGSGPVFWRVAEMGEEGPQALTFAGTASMQTQDPHVWLLAEQDATPDCQGTLTAELEGAIKGGRLWKLTGQGRVFVSGGNASIRTGAEKDDRDEIHAIGPLEYRILDGSGTPVYSGIPSILFRRAGRGFRQLSGKDLRYRIGRRATWCAGVPPADTMGRVDFSVKDGQGIGARIAANVVPQNISVLEIDNRDSAGRRFRFEGLQQGWTLRVGEGDSATINCTGAAEVVLPSGAASRGRLPLVLASPDGAAPLVWALDLPRKHGELQDLEGEVLSQNREISMQDLRGWRLVPAESGKTELRVRLEGAAPGISPVIGRAIGTEQPLSAFRPVFEEMLVCGGPDAELRLRVVTGGVQSARLIVRHSLGETRIEQSSVSMMVGLTPIFDVDLQVVAVDMDDPSRVREADAQQLTDLGEGRWFLLPRRNGVPMRPPRPFVQPAPSDSVNATAPRRKDRIAHFAAFYRNEAVEADLSRLATLAGVLIAHGVSPSALDQVVALSSVPEAAVRILMRVHHTELEDMLSLELHGGPRWIFVSPGLWAKAFSMEAESLRVTFATIPSLAEKADGLMRDHIASRTAEILRLRPSLLGQVVLGLLQAVPGAVPIVAALLGGWPAVLQKPEKALLDCADEVVRRNATTAPRLHDLAAIIRPAGFDRFDPELRGLIDAPLFVAEVAFGLRPQPSTRQKVELLQAILTDTGSFETMLPAAVAWHANRTGTEKGNP